MLLFLSFFFKWGRKKPFKCLFSQLPSMAMGLYSSRRPSRRSVTLSVFASGPLAPTACCFSLLARLTTYFWSSTLVACRWVHLCLQHVLEQTRALIQASLCLFSPVDPMYYYLIEGHFSYIIPGQFAELNPNNDRHCLADCFVLPTEI